MSSVSRLHILPLDSEGTDRAEHGLQLIRSKIGTEIREGSILEGNWIVVKSEPDTGNISADTEVFLEGPIIRSAAKVQIVAVANSANEHLTASEAETVADGIFDQVVGPEIQRRARLGAGLIATVGGSFSIGDRSFVLAAAQVGNVESEEFGEPRETLEEVSNIPASRASAVLPGAMVAITLSTTVYLSVDSAEEFTRIHVVPFQDTLPRAYDFDLFSDYLRPYFRSHALDRFSPDQQFSFRGVQFRVVAVEPADRRSRRVGAGTVVYCDGVLHPSLRNVLPPELLEQLALLPPGLQLLLMNTDSLGGLDVYERMAGLQEQLQARRGLSEETIALIPIEPWRVSGGSSSSEQCMICLADFVPEEQVRRLPCGHLYHCACIDEWLRRCTDCPLCKMNVDRNLRGY